MGEKEINKNPFYYRLYLYQKKRFPVLAHGILIGAFTFSAMAYSLKCRRIENIGLELFSLTDYLLAFFNTFFLFFLLRISDEFKDADYDKVHRPYLPVPSGLIQFSELKLMAIVVLLALLTINFSLTPGILVYFLFILGYLFLMHNEFFVHEYLNKRQILYVITHMMIIPLVDLYASAFEWQGEGPDIVGLSWFFALSFFNGLTLEFGRKIQSPNNQEHNAYSRSMGFEKSMQIFRWVLSIGFLLAMGVAGYCSMSVWHYVLFAILYVLCLAFSIKFSKDKSIKYAKNFEKLSGIWAVMMYLNLGLSLFF